MDNPDLFFQAVKVIKDAYDNNTDFRNTVHASIMSVFKELKGSYSDEVVAEAIAERLFGDD